MAHQYTASLTTRALLGLVGIPAVLISLLAVDLMWFRPRTRLLDQVRLESRTEVGAPDHEVVERAEARWSWFAVWFPWLWLLGKKLGRYALVFIGLQIILTVVGTRIGASLTPPEVSPMGPMPSAVVSFWQPMLKTLAVGIPFVLMPSLSRPRGRAGSRGGR